jgi:MYXO-CTERM domain-containing protein
LQPRPCTIDIAFIPPAIGDKEAVLLIESNDPNNPQMAINLSGQVKGPLVQVVPTAYDFGQVIIGESKTIEFAILNQGSLPLTVEGLELTDAESFSLDLNGGSNPCLQAMVEIEPGHDCTVAVVFAPNAVSSFDSSLLISNSDPQNGKLEAGLSGEGIEQAEEPGEEPPEELNEETVSDADGGTTLDGSTITETDPVTDSGCGCSQSTSGKDGLMHLAGLLMLGLLLRRRRYQRGPI